MFKFIKNLLGLGKKSNTFSTENVIATVDEVVKLDSQELTFAKRKQFKVFEPYVIGLEDLKNPRRGRIAFREAKDQFNNYGQFGTISRNGRFTTERGYSKFAVARTHDPKVNIRVEVFPSDKKTTGYELSYIGNLSETQSNFSKSIFNKDELIVELQKAVERTKLNA